MLLYTSKKIINIVIKFFFFFGSKIKQLLDITYMKSITEIFTKSLQWCIIYREI